MLFTTSITKNALLPIWQSIITILICQYIQHRSLLSHYEKNRIQNDTLKLQNNWKQPVMCELMAVCVFMGFMSCYGILGMVIIPLIFFTSLKELFRISPSKRLCWLHNKCMWNECDSSFTLLLTKLSIFSIPHHFHFPHEESYKQQW